jgi:MYXO-CTERM domain-containing protein
VCCNAACAGSCEACIEALTNAADGTCSAIPAGADPQNECSTDSGYPESCKADGMCDGERACRELAVEGTACGEPSCSGDDLNVAICNSAGACVGQTVACMPYACAANVCRSECMADADCAFGNRCVADICVERGTSLCSDDGSASLSEGDLATPCREYLCDTVTGLCRTECLVTSECASGAICDTAVNECRAADVASATEDAGCGCRMAPNGTRAGFIALLAVLGGLRRRRRAH